MSTANTTAKANRTLPDRTVLSKQIAAARTPEDRDPIIKRIAITKHTGAITPTEIDDLINEIAVNPVIACNKQAIKSTLKQFEAELKKDEVALRRENRIVGGYGEYVLDEGAVKAFRKVQGGVNAQPDVICGALNITAETYDTGGGSRGLLLEWTNTLGQPKQWLMPVTAASGDGLQAIKTLEEGGLHIISGNEKLVIDYIKSVGRDVERNLTCTDKTGWHGDRFVTPDTTYGSKADDLMFQSLHTMEVGYGNKGTLKDWQQHISSKAIGNPRLMLAISAAFTGTLLNKTDMAGFGLHFFGGSSIGKTTLLLLASGVWGRPRSDGGGCSGYMRQWNGTAVSFEGIALMHNDGLLVLDEVGEASPKVVANTAYMLGNGTSKARGNRDGSTKAVKRFKVVFLSSGETTLDQMIKSEGGTTRAGQEVRMLHLKADAGTGSGIFNQCEDGAKLAEQLDKSAARYYGVAGIEWLKAVTAENGIPEDISRAVDSIRAELLPTGSGGQVSRVAKQFALIAYAGELATEHGITGWNAGDSTSAAKACFSDWLTDFGDANGNRESTHIISAVRSFLFKHEDRFQDMDISERSNPDPVRDRAGGRRKGILGDYEYVVPSSELMQLAKGYGRDQIVEALAKAGMIDDVKAKQIRLFGSRPYCYVIKPVETEENRQSEPDF